MTVRSQQVLLEGLVDYAGLFPPAALSMQDAVRNYARYRESADAWMLGRFVVHEDRVEEVPPEFPLSVLWAGGDLRVAMERGTEPPVLEAKAATPEDVAALAAAARGGVVYVEITDLALLGALRESGLRAKIRTGGITAEAFPVVERVAAFIRGCRERSVPFKATAGLHHPLRCVKPLTYEPDAPTGTMHGFLNVFLTAGFPGEEERVLRETDPAAFAFDDEGASWRGRRLGIDDLRALRRFAVSFGSCSFEEPVADLRELGWLR